MGYIFCFVAFWTRQYQDLGVSQNLIGELYCLSSAIDISNCSEYYNAYGSCSSSSTIGDPCTCSTSTIGIICTGDQYISDE